MKRSRRRTKSVDSAVQFTGAAETEGSGESIASHACSVAVPDSVTTMQFVHAFSALRIISVLAVMLALSVLAALLWVFLGQSTWALPESRSQAQRVGSEMLVDVLVLAMEGVMFAVWLVGSWMWL